MFNDIFGIQANLLGICSSSVGILFNLLLLIIFLYRLLSMKRVSKSSSRQIGLLHTMNTYVHLTGILSTLLIMCLRTFYGDFYSSTRDSMVIAWHCHFLSYLFSFFGAGVYGSCFLQAIFRYWRIMFSQRIQLLQKPLFHLLLIVMHWILVSLLIFPTIFRSIYIPSDHVCVIPFDDRWTAAYIASIVTLLPVTGIFILYIKIILYMKNRFQTRKKRKRMRNDLSTIRRIFFLVMIILQTSSAGVILWILTFFQENLHRLFYRLLRLLVILCMLICSMALLFLSPQLRRILRTSQQQHRAKKRPISSTNTDEPTPSRSAQLPRI